MNESRRIWALTALSAVVISAIGLAIATVGGGDGDDQAIATPSAPIVSASPSLEPTLTPPPDESPAATSVASPTTSVAPTTAPTTAPTPPPSGSASTVNCSQTPSYCSSTTGVMVIGGGNLGSESEIQHGTDYTHVPKTTMTSTPVKADGSEAKPGDEVKKLKVRVVVRNGTDKTFVFPKREVALDVERDGDSYRKLKTDGPAFEMPPKGEMVANFEVPIGGNGQYTWRGKTFFYQK